MAVALALLHSAGCSIQYRSKAGYVGDNHSAFDESGDDAVFLTPGTLPLLIMLLFLASVF